MIKIDINKELIGSNGKMNLDVNLHIYKGDFVALTGLSGSGKTTLLRIIAGLEESNSHISVNGKIWQDEKTNIPVQKRQIGFVFQDYALFPNMSVIENLLFVKNDIKLANELLEITELSKLKNRNVTTLSGGQKQRVSLCRALMNRPKLLLMDEPLSALDPAIRTKLQDEILTLHKKFNITTIMVSHDPSEIYRLSNKVVVLQNGIVIKEGNAKDVLLKTSGSAKFSFEGELLDIVKIDVIYVAIISIGQQLVEVALSEDEAKGLEIGSKVRVSTKAFSPTISL
ncbi:ABC transporter ATP-binding protein [Arcobacter sp. CECT 8985]|uniref:ABC transporter ATP-binding protein n=1 Tax=Arcobacter sp. CECT 8985 TaxID=1935424 RepID=UPI00100B3585|nr:ATP-binding cassette domain-containing protein [Arcobacter sp. CECT 8985]RXJ86538.1 molybdenum ABC transporter ATP-binding protein [Arcobacter sp. CECT 8985]